MRRKTKKAVVINRQQMATRVKQIISTRLLFSYVCSFLLFIIWINSNSKEWRRRKFRPDFLSQTLSCCPSRHVNRRMQLRILSLNIWGVHYISKLIPQRIEALIEHLLGPNANYDIIGLQEVPAWHREATRLSVLPQFAGLEQSRLFTHSWLDQRDLSAQLLLPQRTGRFRLLYVLEISDRRCLRTSLRSERSVELRTMTPIDPLFFRFRLQVFRTKFSTAIISRAN